MKPRFRFSIGALLMWTTILALCLTVFFQHRRRLAEVNRLLTVSADLHRKLAESQQLLEALPVEDPQRVYVLATPSFAYARWAWRAYLPPGARYALHLDQGASAEKEGTRHVVATKGKSQQIGLRGRGETTIVVELFHQDSHKLLGMRIGQHETVCHLTPEVSRCLAKRLDYRSTQAGKGGAVDFAVDERIDLLQRWYPLATAPGTEDPVGFSVWLEPF